jgi:hypothetical protein
MAVPQAADRVQVGSIPAREERRKSHRSDPAFQNRFRLALMQLVLVALVPAVALSLVVNHVVLHPDAFLESPWVLLGAVVACLASAMLIVGRCDRVSNRYCGPTYRIIQVLEAIERGERVQRPLCVRKNDEFEPLVEHLNRAFVRLGVLDDDGRDGSMRGRD